jgi:hypothetical protein
MMHNHYFAKSLFCQPRIPHGQKRAVLKTREICQPHTRLVSRYIPWMTLAMD